MTAGTLQHRTGLTSWLTVLLLAGAGCTSPSFNFEGKQCGPDNLCPGDLRCVREEDSAEGVCRAPPPASVGPGGETSLFLQDDFEGPFLSSGSPAGLWHLYNPTANTAVPTPEAAHRGSRGLRHTDIVSAEPSPGSGGPQLAVIHDFEASSDRWYVRTWIRTNDPSFTTNGDRTVLNLKSHVFSPPHICELRLTGSEQRVVLGGFNARGSYSEVQAAREVAAGVWHLVELAVENVGTQQGRCVLWIDGALAAERTALDWTGGVVDQLDFGQPYSLDRSFTGTTDFDDLRLSRRPNATSLAVEVPWVPQVEGCLPVKLRLLDAAGTAAPAPYPLDVVVAVEGVEAPLFSDASCLEPSATARFDTGEIEAVGYLRPLGEGRMVLRAAHPDFLSAAPIEEEVFLAPEAPVGCSSAPFSSSLWLALLGVGTWTHRRLRPLLLLALLFGAGSASAASALEEAIRQIQSLEPEAALSTLERERSREDITPAELAKVHLYTGMAQAQLAQVDRARESFRAARLLDPRLTLPEPASPGVRELWAKAAPAAKASITPPAATAPAPAVTAPPLSLPAEPARDAPAWRTGLGIGMVVTGLAAVAGGIAFGLQRGSSAEAVKDEPDVGRALSLARTSHSQTRTANVLFGVGGALALGGGVLIVF